MRRFDCVWRRRRFDSVFGGGGGLTLFLEEEEV